MINETMAELGRKRSAIREIFEFGNKRRAEIGAENVYDFSLGNPFIAPPPAVDEAIVSLLRESNPVDLHGYTSAQGAKSVRDAIAKHINDRYQAGIDPELLYMTCGAAASLSISLNAMVCPGDEVILFAPFFPEYRVFAEKAGAKVVVVMSEEKDFQISADRFAAAITPHTKAVIVNSPNNPSGVVLTAETIGGLARVLREKEAEYGHPIYLIADEPYRELVYDTEVPYLTNEYDDTVVCYSYSKSLSLPGERIGYIAVCPRAADAAGLYAAVCGAGRALGYVCAPSLFQRVVERCVDQTADIDAYRVNRDLLYGALTDYGYDCIHPDGAFYLFVRSPEPDAAAFCEKAKQFDLLLVPADSFGTPGFFRVAYCVSRDMIERALPAFKKLIETY